LGVILEDGSPWYFRGTDDGGYQTPDGLFLELRGNSHGSTYPGAFLLTEPDQTLHVFDSDGKRTSTVDPYGNETTYQYQGDYLSLITDPYGLTTEYVYAGGILDQVIDFAGRVFDYEIADGLVRSITLPDPDDDGPLLSPMWQFEHDTEDRLTDLIDPLGGTTQFDYDTFGPTARLTTVTYPDGTQTSIDSTKWRALVDTSVTAGTQSVTGIDPSLYFAKTTMAGVATTTTHDRFGQPLSLSRSDGWWSVYQRDQNGLPVFTHSPSPTGGTLNRSFVYDDRGRVTYESTFETILGDSSGDLDSFQRHYTRVPGLGYIVGVTDELGRERQFIRDVNDGGELLAYRAEPGGRDELSFTYTQSSGVLPAGLILTQTDAAGVLTQHQYHSNPGETDFGLIASTTVSQNGLDARTTSFEYDENRNLKYITDAEGQVTRLVHDNLDRLIAQGELYMNWNTSIEDAYIAEESFQYDANGSLIAHTDRAGRTTDYDHDPMGRITDVWRPAPVGTDSRSHFQTSYTNGRVDQTIDAVGDVTTYAYDQGRLTRVTRPSPTGDGLAEIDYATNPAGMVIEVTASNGWTLDDTVAEQTVTELIRYDMLGNMIHRSFADDDGVALSETWKYDAAGRLRSSADGTGRPTRYYYDALDRLDYQEILNTGDGFGWDIIDYDYNDSGYLIQITDPTNIPTVYGVNIHGDVIAERTPNPQTRDTTNPDSSEPIDEWVETTYDVDDLGRVTMIDEPSGLTTTFRYHRTGAVDRVSVLGPDIQFLETTYEIDTSGRVYAELYADGSFMYYEYNGMDEQPTRTIHANNDGSHFRDTGYIYDAMGRLAILQQANGDWTIYNYDSDDNLVETRQSSTDGDWLNEETWVYDDLGRNVRHQGSDQVISDHVYDAAGNLTSTIVGGGALTQYTYDVAGRIESLTDPVGNVTRWFHDQRGLVKREQNVAGDSRYFEYDAAGRPTEITTEGGDSIERIYNRAGLLESEIWISDGIVTDTREFDYDPAGRLVRAADNDSEVSRGYNAIGALTFESTQVNGFDGITTLEKTHDFMHRIDARSLNVDSSLILSDSFTYDSISQVTGINRVNADGSGLSVIFGYDALGRLTDINRGVTSSGTFTTMPSTRIDFYPTGRVAAITHTAEGDLAASLPSDALVVDPDTGMEVINRTVNEFSRGSGTSSMVHTRHSLRGDDGGQTQFVHDTEGQLQFVENANDPFSDGFIHDSAGNRIFSSHDGQGTSYNTGVDNQLNSDGQYNYTYDEEGRRIGRTAFNDGIDSGGSDDWGFGGGAIVGRLTDRYFWDVGGQLTSIESGDHTGAMHQKVGYLYDALGRRVAKQIDVLDSAALSRYAHGGQIDEGGSEGWMPQSYAERFVHDGDHMLAVLDEGGDVREQVLHGVLVDQVLAEEKFVSSPIGSSERTAVLITLADDQQSIRDVVRFDDESGTVDAYSHIDYTAFGVEQSHSDPSIQTRFGFTGRDRDVESDLQYNRARYLDPQAGRWLSQDPIGFAAGDANLYRYVGNQPTTKTDPSGLEPPQLSPEQVDDLVNNQTPLIQPNSPYGGIRLGAHGTGLPAGAYGPERKSTRPLTPGEVAMLNKFFEGHLNTDGLCVGIGKLHPFAGRNSITPRYTPWFPKSNYAEDFSRTGDWREGHFIHEMTHVLQSQNGNYNVADFFYHLLKNRFQYGLTYYYDLDDLGKPLYMFNFEQQAKITEHYYEGAGFHGKFDEATMERCRQTLRGFHTQLPAFIPDHRYIDGRHDIFDNSGWGYPNFVPKDGPRKPIPYGGF
ncbi:MAG: RHS repeat-associated core domain-containing protein, partial [Planctomycetota bacterium]